MSEEFDLEDVAKNIVKTVYTDSLHRRYITRWPSYGESLYVIEKIFTALHYAGCQVFIDALLYDREDCRRGSLQTAIDYIRSDRRVCENALKALVQYFYEEKRR